ncbi:MAG: hypothetical protein EYC62_09340 [Alphaproteobacteria bacterium]|nr:MAG: hypothetical protein EYC62_09340 [Alphaproteobacteria bacterium]
MNIFSSLKKIVLIVGVIIALQFVIADHNPAFAQNTAQSVYDNAIARLCWACPALGVFYESSVVLGYKISQAIVNPLQKILGGALGLWLLWNIAKIFMPFGSAAGIGEVFNRIASRLALFIFLLVFLSNTGFGLVWEYIINPIYITGLNLSSKVLEETANNTGVFAGTIGSDNCAYNTTPFVGFDALVNVDAGHLEEMRAAGRRMLCLANDVQRVMGVGAAMGMMGMFLAGSDVVIAYDTYTIGGGRWLPSVDIPVPNLGDTIANLVKMLMMFIAGIVLAIVFVLAILIYPIYLLDAMFRLGIIITISPLLIASYLFEMTRGWAVQAIKMLVGIAATLLFQSILVGISVTIITTTITEVGQGANSIGSFLEHSAVKAAFAFQDSIMLVWFSFFTAGFLVLYMMKSASKIAQEFVGMGVGDDIRGGVVGAAQKVATMAVYAGAAIATGGASLAAGAGAGALPESGAVAGAGGPPGGGPAPALGTGGGGSPAGGSGVTGVLAPQNFSPPPPTPPAGGGGGTGGGGVTGALAPQNFNSPSPAGGTGGGSPSPGSGGGFPAYGSTITGPGFSGSVTSNVAGQTTLGPLPPGFGTNMPTGNFGGGGQGGGGPSTITGPVTATGNVTATGTINTPGGGSTGGSGGGSGPTSPPPPPTAGQVAAAFQNSSHAVAQGLGLDGTSPSGQAQTGGVGGGGFAGGGFGGSAGGGDADALSKERADREALEEALRRSNADKANQGGGSGPPKK